MISILQYLLPFILLDKNMRIHMRNTNIGDFVFCINQYFVMLYLEVMEGIDLGETTHKKPGTTVPESIHSFSESLPDLNHRI